VRIPSSLLYLAAVLIGLGLAVALTRPRPHDETQAELQAKAVEYYKASKVFDFRTMASLYSPAYQQAEAAELRDLAARRVREFSNFKEQTRKDLQYSADSISLESVRVEVEGDWAVSSGTFKMNIDGQDNNIDLEEMVWLRSDGQWWIYQLKPIELSAYGNPPDRFRQLLLKPKANTFTNLRTEQTPTTTGDAGAAAPAAEPPAPAKGQ